MLRPNQTATARSFHSTRLLEDLQEPDDLSLRFNPLGFGSRLAPEDSAAFYAHQVQLLMLPADVPEHIREGFDRVRKVFIYGLLEYELFTASYALAHFVLEGALRTRFMDYYSGSIPITRDGVADTLDGTSFEDYRRSLFAAAKHDQKMWLRGSGKPLPRTYESLYAWARTQGLLPGQRNIGAFGSLVKLRNWVAHPESHMVTVPPEVFRLLRDVSEIIAKLWGHDTPGGRLFPGPVQRWPRLAGISPDRTKSLQYGSLTNARSDDEADWTYLLCLASREEDLIAFDASNPGHMRFAYIEHFDVTHHPIAILAGPGPWDAIADAMTSLADDEPADAVPFQDRIFYIRVADHGVELPRSPTNVAATTCDDDTALWYAIRADDPIDAFLYVRDLDPGTHPEVVHLKVMSKPKGDKAARRHAKGHIPSSRVNVDDRSRS
jgi:hypothetical protein